MSDAGLATRWPTSLISATDLATRWPVGPALTLLDVRWELGTGAARADFVTGHIPGAVFVDLDRELAARAGPAGRHPLPGLGDFAAAMRTAGVGDERAVVVYDARTSVSAARAWWLLRYFGHPAVAVLDGGLAAWVAAGGDLASGAPDAVTPGSFTARPGGMPVLDAAGAAEMAARGVLLDARTPERFSGASEPVDPVAGHIPGARNTPMAQTIETDGRFRAPAALREVFGAAGAMDATTALPSRDSAEPDPSAHSQTAAAVGAYCGSGVTAAHQVLALELAGLAAALYPGSWSEWIADPERPVATGP